VGGRTWNLRPRPLNLTFSVTYRCNASARRATSGRSASTISRCRVRADLQSDRPLALLGHVQRRRAVHSPDLIDIVLACYDHCAVDLTIPTNGLLTSRSSKAWRA